MKLKVIRKQSHLNRVITILLVIYGLNNDKGLIVVVHGLGRADDYLAQIMYFVDSGFKVFAYDSTGCYDSEGNSIKGFPQAVLDYIML